MKVLILITKSGWGGANRYVYDLATNLPKNQFEVEVMAGGNGPFITALLEAGIKAEGTLPIGRDVNFFEDVKAFFKLIKILKEKTPDVLHVNSSKIGGLGALAGRVAGVPRIVFTAHGWAFNENRSIVSKFFIKFLYWIIMFLSHVTIAVSEGLKYQIRNWPAVYDKMTVIHNGIKPEAAFSRVNARNELIKMNPQFAEAVKTIAPKDLVVIGSVGELHHIKGYDYSLRAVRELNKKVLYIILGEGEEREHLQKTIKDLELESTVIMFGFVPKAYQYLKAFDIFLLPSLSEALPYLGLEAGLAGLPIIATAVGGIPEIVDDMKSGILIQPRNSKEIKHSIEFYINHKKVQKEYGAALHTKILEKFSLNKMILETAKIFTIR